MSDDAIIKAERTLSSLQAKRAAAAARAEAISRERESIGYAVFVDDDAAARKQLEKLNAEGATIAGNLEALDAAIAKATEKVVAAKAAAAKAADRQQALALRGHVVEFVECGKQADAALAMLIAATHGMRAALNAIHGCGSDFPSHQQLLSLGEHALKTGLMQMPGFARAFEHLPPSSRRSFSDLFEGWASMIERNNISPRLGEELAQQQEAPRHENATAA
jgi:hypothetical protein